MCYCDNHLVLISSKETFVPIYDVSLKSKFYGSNLVKPKNHLAKERWHKHKHDFQ